MEPAGLRLVIEVTSASTRRRDLSIKRELYREWEVPYLVIDRGVAPVARTVFGSLPAWITLDDLRIG